MDMWIIWLIIIIILSVLEAVTINLVCIWFIASGLVSLFLSFFIDSFYIEFAVFVVLGLILMFLTRPILVKKFAKNGEKTNLDRVMDSTGIVTKEITKNEIGEVKIDGKHWSAISKEEIPVGSTVIVDSIDGVKLIVKKGD